VWRHKGLNSSPILAEILTKSPLSVAANLCAVGAGGGFDRARREVPMGEVDSKMAGFRARILRAGRRTTYFVGTNIQATTVRKAAQLAT
jgi:hypothetical protein